MTTSVAGQAHRSPRSKKIIASEWGYGQIQGVLTPTVAGISLRPVGRVRGLWFPSSTCGGCRWSRQKGQKVGNVCRSPATATPGGDRP